MSDASSRTTWQVLRTSTDYRRLYLAQIVSQGGDWFTMVPLIVLLQELTGNGALGALLLAVETLVIAVLSLYAGGIVDRVQRRTVLVTAQASSGLAVLLLLLLRSGESAWIGVVTYGLLAIGKSFFTPAVSATVPDVVAEDDLLVASTSLSALWGVMLAVGASLGGLAAAATSPYVCFIVTVLAYLASAVLLTGLCAPTATAPGAQVGGIAQFRDDARAVLGSCRSDHRLPILMSAKPCTHIGNGAIALFPALALTMTEHPEIVASLLYAARGVGAMLGPVLGRRAAQLTGSLRLPLLGAMIIFAIGYACVPLTNSVLFAFTLVTVAHIGGSMSAGLSGYGLQISSPSSMRGRIFAVDNMIAMLAIASSQTLVSVGLLTLEARTVMLICAGVVALSATTWWIYGRHTSLSV